MGQKSKTTTASPSEGKPGPTGSSAQFGLSTNPHEPWVTLGVSVFLAAIVWIVFGQTLGHQFIDFDDDEYVFKNAQVAMGLTQDGIVWAFTHFHANNWHPLTWISHMLDCQFYGLNPAGHHFTNVLIHAVTAILLFTSLRQMTGSIWRSAFVAVIFAIHPLRVESVAWVAERKDVLSGLFFVLTILAYVRYARRPWSPLRYGIVVLLFGLGLMCKPMLVTTPFVLLLLDYWPLNRFVALEGPKENSGVRAILLEKLPLLGLSVASSIVTLFAQRNSIAPVTLMPPWLRLGNGAVAYVDYLRQLFWPINLAVLYPWDESRLSVWKILGACILLAGISAGTLVLFRKRYLLTGWLWYLVMLVPVIGILQVGNQARADRYTYLPQIGLCVLLVWGVSDLSTRWRYRSPLLASLSGIVIVALIFLARAQASYWKDSETLWSHAFACTTQNIIAEGNLGRACYANGKTREAIAHFQNSLRIAPNQAPIHSCLGVFYLETGEVTKSLAHLERALEIEPNFADAHYNLANTYLYMGRAKDALTHYEKALATNPDDIEALNNMAWILATWPDALTRDGPRAVELAARADALTRTKSPMASATLAAAYAEANRFPEAIETAQRALQLALSEGNTSRADSIREQIEAYQSGAAYRDRRSTLP